LKPRRMAGRDLMVEETLNRAGGRITHPSLVQTWTMTTTVLMVVKAGLRTWAHRKSNSPNPIPFEPRRDHFKTEHQRQA
jgi:hypothetical protein